MESMKVVVLMGRKKLRKKAGLFFSIITKVVPKSMELNMTTRTNRAGKR